MCGNGVASSFHVVALLLGGAKHMFEQLQARARAGDGVFFSVHVFSLILGILRVLAIGQSGLLGLVG